MFTSEISCPTYTCLEQSVEHCSDDQEVLGSITTGVNFLAESILLLSCKPLLARFPTFCNLGRTRRSLAADVTVLTVSKETDVIGVLTDSKEICVTRVLIVTKEIIVEIAPGGSKVTNVTFVLMVIMVIPAVSCFKLYGCLAQ